MAATKRILIIQTAFLGDLLLSVPLIKHLKSTFPGVEISVVCRKGFGSLLTSLGLVDRALEIEKKKKETYRQALEAFGHIEFDLLLCPHESFTTASFSKKVRARKKIAFHKWWNFFFFTERIKKDLSLPDALRQMSLLQEFDPLLKKNLQDFHKQDLAWKKQNSFLLTPVPDWASPVVNVNSRFAEVQSNRGLKTNYVCLFPGSVWKTKQWSEEGFVGTGKGLAQQGLQVVVMGGPGEEELAARVAKQIPESLNLAGQTNLLESLVILSKAQVVISNDSAGQHLAALVAAPTLSVFGPTVLEFGFRPWNSFSTVVEREGLACRPCGKHGHHKCPLNTHECMKSIQSKEVLERIEKLQKATQSL